MIQTTVQRTLGVLQDPSYQGRSHRQERLARAEQTILPHFDAREFARETLGSYWNQRSAAEKDEFVHLFTDLVARTYADDIDRDAKGIKIVYGKQSIEGSHAEVDTRVISPSETEPVSIDYFMHQVNGDWLIDDVQVDHVSIALNYHSQFTNVISQSSYADLVKRIKSKLQQLGVAA
jgi:phospholipid transport system substrate-binding protein